MSKMHSNMVIFVHPEIATGKKILPHVYVNDFESDFQKKNFNMK